MDMENEVYVTSRSRTPSLIDVKSQHERVFAELPDLIQEAVVSTEFSNPRLRISRAPGTLVDTEDSGYVTLPMFYITSRTDSGIDLPDLEVKDEKFLGKYGSDLTANFADIRAYGSKAFFQKQNLSDHGAYYSLCTCTTGYIWVYVSQLHQAHDPETFSDAEVQIGTFALKAKAITTTEVSFKYKSSGPEDHLDGQIALLCSTVLAKYLRLRMIGRQYEEATETAIRQSRKELSFMRMADPGKFENFDLLLREVCTKAPMPPTSDVSLISRSMITRRWQVWRDTSILRRRISFPQRVAHCFTKSQHDSMDLLSECFSALNPPKSKIPLLRT